MSDIDFSDVLIHHGVKGMKWGVRKKIDRSSESWKDNQKRKLKTVAYIAAGAAIAVGAAYVTAKLVKGRKLDIPVKKLAVNTQAVSDAHRQIELGRAHLQKQAQTMLQTYSDPVSQRILRSSPNYSKILNESRGIFDSAERTALSMGSDAMDEFRKQAGNYFR